MNKQELTTDQALQILDTAIAGIPAKREEHQLLMDALTTLAKASAPQDEIQGEIKNGN